MFFRGIQNWRAHANLNVPEEGLYFGVVGPPDIQDVGTIEGQGSPNCRAGNHMPQSEGSDSVKWCFGVWLERKGFTLTDLLDGNQGHPRDHFGDLQLLDELFKSTNFGKD